MAFKVTAIILAAGKSQRMGQPKMVLPWRGTTVLGRVVEVFSAACVRNLFIVTGGDREKVEQEITRLKNTFPVTPVYNPDHENGGMLSSILAGLSAIPQDTEAVLIGLGDQPQVKIATVKKILDLFTQRKQGIIIPSYNHRRGHPILLDSAMIGELKIIKPESSLRDFLNTHIEEISYVAADNSVLQDLDTPQEYEKNKGMIELDQAQNNGTEKL